MPAVEQRTTPEQAASAELGRQAYDAITVLATHLLATPEFSEALGRAFFRRQRSRSTQGNEIPSVYFNKGEFGYLVEWHSTRFEPGSHGQPERADMIRSWLTVTQYDPTEVTDGWEKKVAKAHVESDFVEGQKGAVERFVRGRASIEQGYDLNSSWETPKSWRTADRPAQTLEGQDALGKLPEVFPDLYPTSVRI